MTTPSFSVRDRSPGSLPLRAHTAYACGHASQSKVWLAYKVRRHRSHGRVYSDARSGTTWKPRCPIGYPDVRRAVRLSGLTQPRFTVALPTRLSQGGRSRDTTRLRYRYLLNVQISLTLVRGNFGDAPKIFAQFAAPLEVVPTDYIFREDQSHRRSEYARTNENGELRNNCVRHRGHLLEYAADNCGVISSQYRTTQVSHRLSPGYGFATIGRTTHGPSFPDGRRARRRQLSGKSRRLHQDR